MTNGRPLKFKFLYLDADGDVIRRSFRYKGQVDDKNIFLAKSVLPLELLVDVYQKFDRLIISFDSGGGKVTILGIAIKGGMPAEIIKRHIDRFLSHFRAERRRDELKRQSREHEFRIEICKHCGASIDVTDFPRTPQVYCKYCDTVATLTSRVADAEESRLRFCDQCKLYADPEIFTEFYYQLYLMSWQMSSKYMCRSCMKSKAWFMLFANIWFLVGAPFAIYQIFRSYFGGRRLQAFAGLGEGNSKFKRKKYLQSAEIYKQIERRVRHCAGVKYNRGLSMELAQASSEAIQAYEQSLADCSNYFPAAEKLATLYMATGRESDCDGILAKFGPAYVGHNYGVDRLEADSFGILTAYDSVGSSEKSGKLKQTAAEDKSGANP